MLLDISVKKGDVFLSKKTPNRSTKNAAYLRALIFTLAFFLYLTCALSNNNFHVSRWHCSMSLSSYFVGVHVFVVFYPS